VDNVDNTLTLSNVPDTARNYCNNVDLLNDSYAGDQQHLLGGIVLKVVYSYDLSLPYLWQPAFQPDMTPDEAEKMFMRALVHPPQVISNYGRALKAKVIMLNREEIDLSTTGAGGVPKAKTITKYFVLNDIGNEELNPDVHFNYFTGDWIGDPPENYPTPPFATVSVDDFGDGPSHYPVWHYNY
jgi:hypothetical protein